MKTVGIILINFNGWEDTKECLVSLTKVNSELAQIRVFVVDNASSSDIRNKISDFRKKNKKLEISFIQNKENLGFAGGNNTGIAECMEQQLDYVMLLNNDTVVNPGFIDPFIELFEREPQAGILAPKIYFASGYEYHKDRYSDIERGKVLWYAGGIIDWNNVYASHRGVDEVDIGQYNRSVKTDFVSGCLMMIKRELIEQVGMFDEKYFMYLEDVDLCMRAVKAGFELWYVPKSIIWHKNAQSSGKSGSDLHVYYQTRNRLLFGFRYATSRTRLALIRDSIRKLRKSDIQKKAVLDYYSGRLGKQHTL